METISRISRWQQGWGQHNTTPDYGWAREFLFTILLLCLLWCTREMQTDRRSRAETLICIFSQKAGQVNVFKAISIPCQPNLLNLQAALQSSDVAERGLSSAHQLFSHPKPGSLPHKPHHFSESVVPPSDRHWSPDTSQDMHGPFI